jgi:hypothetical protein
MFDTRSVKTANVYSMASQENVKTPAVVLRADFSDGTNVIVERDRIQDALIVMHGACIPAGEFTESPCSADDDETRAFIEGWNARLAIPDFEKALHWFNRRRAGI